MNVITLQFGKDKTAIIKGVAILFMIVLHCGTPDWFIRNIPVFDIYPQLHRVTGVFKLCVGIFTFLVGYGYAHSKYKDWKYSLSHSIRLLIPFWSVLLITLPFIFINEEFQIGKFCLNLFGINSAYNYFSWFVAFYIYAMIVMPFMSRAIDRNPYLNTILLIGVVYLLSVLIYKFVPDYSSNDWTQRLFDCFSVSPIMLVGYLFAKKQLFQKFVVPRNWYVGLICIAVMLVVLILRYYISSIMGFNLDVVYSPLFILAILCIFNIYKLPKLSLILSTLGKYSVYMWFVHALFFTKVTREYFQPLILISDNLFIITTWTIIITFVLSVLLSKIVEFIQCNLRILNTK